MIACKVSIFFAFLFVCLFAFGLSLQAKGNSLKSYGGSSCTVTAIGGKVKTLLAGIEGPIADLSYDDTLTFVKNITNIYFTPDCVNPSFVDLYDGFSTVKFNNDLSVVISNGMIIENVKINRALSATGSISFDVLIKSIKQIASWSEKAFTFSYDYASIQWLICAQLLALELLATKTPGANETATELLNTGIDTCSSELSGKEYSMVETFLSGSLQIRHYGLAPTVEVYVSYTAINSFIYNFFCDPKKCAIDCSGEAIYYNYYANKYVSAFGKVFNAEYCRMRDLFPLYDSSYNIVAANCLDFNLYLERDFISGQWQQAASRGGKFVSGFDKGEMAKGGIFMEGPYENLFIDIENGKVQNDTVVKCHKVELLTRCQVGLPPLKGPCHL